MKNLDKKAAIALLKKTTKQSYRPIIKHSTKVAEIANEIAKQIMRRSKKVDLHFVETASLLHDIGRHKCPPFTKKSPFHGVNGAIILRKNKLEKHARAAERHLGGGISSAEAKRLGFPKGIYTPKSIEEKIVCYADKLASSDKKITIKEAIQRFKAEISRDAANRIIRLHNELIRKGMNGRRIDTIC